MELPGVKDKARVRELLQGTANLEFWETSRNGEVAPMLDQANVVISKYFAALENKKDTSVVSNDTLLPKPLYLLTSGPKPPVPLLPKPILPKKTQLQLKQLQ